MSDTHQVRKCLDPEDKRFILKIIDDKIDRENVLTDNIKSRQKHMLSRPPTTEPFIRIRLSLIRAHEELKKKVEDLKNRIDEYPECSICGTGTNRRVCAEPNREHFPPARRELAMIK